MTPRRNVTGAASLMISTTPADDARPAGAVRLKALLALCALLFAVCALPFIARTRAAEANTQASVLSPFNSAPINLLSPRFSWLGDESNIYTKILASRNGFGTTLYAPLFASTIAVQDFESSPATPTWTFTGSANSVTGNSHGVVDRPASSTFYVSTDTAASALNQTTTMTFANTSLAGYTGVVITFRVAAFSINNTANGMDGGDSVIAAVSTDGGTIFTNQVQINGNTNARWHYTTGTANASTTLGTPIVVAPAAGGARTTDGYSTVTISVPDGTSQVSLRITAVDDSANERWCIDDVVISGNATPAPDLTITDLAQAEGNGPGSTNMDFTVTRSGDLSGTSTVNYQTIAGTATQGSCGTPGNDYESTSGLLTFTPTQSTKTISVPICGDTTAEPDETFTVQLSSATNATISDADATGTITNDDAGSVTYTWNPTSVTALAVCGINPVTTNSWICPANWQPLRPSAASASTTDILIFDGTSTPSPTVTNVPTQAISTLQLNNSANAVKLNAATGGARTLTITGNAGLDVQAGSRLEVLGSTGLTVAVTAGSASTINGQIALAGGPHQLTGANPGQIVFSSSAIFSAGRTSPVSGFSGHPFGQGTDQSVQFQDGSSAFFNEGDDPFGDTGNAIVSFTSASNQEFNTSTAWTAHDRSYGNLTLAGLTQTYFDSSASNQVTVMGNLTINSSNTLQLSNVSGGDLNLWKDYTNNGTFTPNGRTVKFSGSGSQAVNTGGAVAGKAFAGFTVSNLSGGVTVNGNLGMGATDALGLTYASGTPTFAMTNGSFNLANTMPVTVTTTSALSAGDYVLISAGSGGSVSGTAPTNLTVAGSGIAPGTLATLQITSSQLVLHVAPAESEVSLTGGNLIITDGNGGTTNDTLTISLTGSNIRINDPGNSLTCVAPATQVDANTCEAPLASVTGNIQVNTLGGNDTLTIALAGGDCIPPGGISYDGGTQTSTPGDKLVITGGSQGTVTYNYTNGTPGAGGVVMSNFGTVNYTGLEPLTNSGDAADIIFNLPAGPTAVTLGDDGVSNTFSRLSGATFETTDFDNPSNSLTINRGNAADTVTVNALPDFDASLAIGSAGNLFSTIAVNGDVEVTAARTISLAAGDVNSSARITNGGGLTVTNTGTSSTLSNEVAGAGGLTKEGAGRLNLAGPNSYSGLTVINAGRLNANSVIPTATTVNSGATLGGIGAISAAVTVNSGGTLSPGNSPGILATGGVAFSSGSTFDIEIGGPAPGNTASNHDRLDANNSVALGGATLSLSSFNSFVPSPGQSFVILNNQSAGATTGTFAGLPEGFVITSFLGNPAVNATITYVGNGDGDNNDVILTTSAACVAPSTVYVDDTWVGTTPGTDPDAGAGPATNFGCDSFATIQDGINGVASNGTVIVYAGNYPENVLVNKSVTLQGPNYNIDPNTGSRVGEAIVRPAVTAIEPVTSGTVFRVGTNSGHINATISGFTIDGNNPSLSGGRMLNGVEVHTGAGIVNSTGSFDTNPGAYDTTMVVTNNIIKNLERYGVLVDNIPARPAVTGNDVSHNKIDNLPSGNNFGGGRGRGIAFEENAYGSATYNVMTRVNVGWQDDNYNLASPGAATLVSHNTIHTYHRGIFHNLQYQSASDATISDNSIFVETSGASAASTTNFGIELSSIQSGVGVTVTNNNSTDNVYGILLWNLPTTADITVTGGTLTGNQYGVYATSKDPQFGDGSASHSIISGVTITNPTVAGIWIDDSATVSATTALGIAGSTTVTGGPTGLLMTGPGARVHNNTLNNTSFTSQTTNYISLSNTASAGIEINGTGVIFDTLTGATATLAQNYAIENKIVHAIDDGTVGFVRVKAGNVFVTPNSFTPTTLTPNIQRAVNAATASDIVHAAAGLYPNVVNVTKALNLEGANVGISGAGVRGAESIIRSNGNQTAVVTVTGSSNVTINGFLLNGDDPAVTGGALYSGDDSNTLYAVRPTGVVTNLTMTNNIATRVAIGIRGDTNPGQGNVVSNNWFDSIGNFDFGYAVSIRNNFYADVTGNKMTRSWTGIHINNHNGAGGPAGFTISGNEIHSYAGGVLYWLQYNGATGATINNNQMTAEPTAVANNFGVLVVSIQNAVNPTFTNNSISGHAYGVGLFNVPTTGTIALGTTNSITNSSLAGVFLTDNLNFNPVGTTNFLAGGPGAASTVNVTGMSITGNTGDGLKIEGTTNTQTLVASGNTITGATGFRGVEIVNGFGSATLTGNNITGFATGLAFVNNSVTTQTMSGSFNRIIGGTNAYTASGTGSFNASVENNWWGCNDGPGNAGCGAISGTGVDSDPWVVLIVSASPTSIPPGGTSTITADMTKNSAAGNPAHGGAATLPLPSANFTATNGDMLPTSNSFSNGLTNSTFTSTNTSTGSACAMVDSQQVCTNITVTPPTFSIDDVALAEGNGPGTTSFTFTITKNGTTNLPATVEYSTADNTATSPSDFTAIATTLLTFTPVETSKQITVLVNGEMAAEPTEAFFVNLNNPTNATILDGQGVGTITNDDCLVAPSTVYVDKSWVGTTPGTDPDGGGLATNFGCDSFATIQKGVDAVANGGTVIVNAGTYDEDVNVNKAGLQVLGAGAGSTNIRGPIGGPGTTVQITANNVTLAGFTITRLGNNTTDWNNPNLNTAGLAIQGTSITGALIRDNIFTGNRTGIDINNSGSHTIRNNVIDFNRTGLILRNQTDSITAVENFITNNWTVGIVFLDGSGGTNSPPQQALHTVFTNNSISSNWYGQIVDRQTGGSLPAPDTTSLKNFRGNWFGTTTPVVTTANSTEPGYAAQIPVAYGGSAGPPGVAQPDIAGPASANIKYIPFLLSGTDTNVETTPGRGTNGFQGVQPANIVVRSNSLDGWVQQTSSTATTSFVFGPAIPPLGEGSGELSVGSDGNSGAQFRQLGFNGTLLSDLTTLSYSAYTSNDGTAPMTGDQTVYIILNVDFDGNGTQDDQLFFEPEYQHGYTGAVPDQGDNVLSTWQTWDALAGGWWSLNTTAGAGPGANVKPLSAIIAAQPNARILSSASGNLRLVAGFGAGSWDNFVGNVDSVRVGVNTVNTTYDFEPLPRISISDVPLPEGNASTTAFTFHVTLSSPSDQPVTVNYQTANSSAVAPTDYTAVASTPITFNPGIIDIPVTVQVNGDTTFEINEQFFVNLSGAANATILDAQGIGTIQNDDACGSFSTVYVDDSWAGTVVGDDPDGGGLATVFGCDSFATIQEGINAVTAGGTIIVADGTYTENLLLAKQVTLRGAQFGVAACGRSATESIVTAAGGTLLTLQGGSASSIIDGFTFSGGARAIESSGGPLNNLQIRNNRFASFTNNAIFLNDPGTDITVTQNSIDGGSKIGAGGLFHLDQDSFNGFHFTNNCITGKGAADTSTGFFVDGNHNVGVSATPRTPLISGNTITNCQTGMNLGRFAFTGTASTNNGTISNNTFSNNLFDGLQGGIQNTTISGNTFSDNGRHGLALTGFSSTVSPDGTRGAINTLVQSNTITGNGFTNAGAGISFNAFQFAGTISTNQAHFNRIVGNATGAIYSGTETINIENNWWGCNFAPGFGGTGCTGTSNGLGGTGAANLDGNPWIVLTTTASPNPTTPGATSTVTANMTLNSDGTTLTPPPSVPPVAVTFSATNGNVLPTSGTITSGQANTTFTSTSTSAGSACSTVDGQQHCTTINIQLPQFAISNVTQVETDSGTTAFVFNVTKSGATTFSSSVQFQTADDSATIADNDYQSNSGTLTFGPTDTLMQITVLVNGDTKFEGNDAFFVNLFNPVDATISDNQGVGTITNDDAQPAISIDNVTHNEGNLDINSDPVLTSYTFNVTISNPSHQTITVDYATANGSAGAPLDFTALPTTTLTFNPGETSKPVTVTVKGDTTYELNETFFVDLTSATNATILDPQGLGTITNDDAAPTLSIGNQSRPEQTSTISGNTTSYQFTVTKAGSTEVTATVNFATAPGTATGNNAPCPSGDDYQNQNGSLSFLANETTKTITVLVCKDADFEADETFFVDLSGEVHATLADGQGLGTIQNDDTPPALSPVNTTNDVVDVNGCDIAHCSLREAINAANASASASIVFAIPAGDPGHFYYADDGVANQVTNDLTHVLTTIESNDANIVGIDPDWPHSWWSIRPASPLPTIATTGIGIFMDGYTQTGASPNTSAPGHDAVLRIEIDGSAIVAGVTHGISVGNGTNSIRGLIINRFVGDGNPETGNGIGISGSDTVRGNFIGTDASGTIDLGNAGSGIASSGFSLNIGGAADADVNLISGNNADGITLSNSNTNLILGNLIGTKANGASGLGNGGAGINLTGGGSVFNTIGGENVGEGNIIAFNVGDGVSLTTAGIGNSIRGNSIFSNGTTNLHLGIDLGTDGVTANDAPVSLDADTGPNNLQNFPVITLAQVTGSTRTITGTLNSTAGATFTIDFYQSTACDNSGNGEGRTYLGSLTTDPTDSGGNVSFTFHPSVLTVGQSVTATATSTGASFSTSEFSACNPVTDGSPGAGDIQFTDATYTVGEGGGTASITVTRVGGSNGSITATFSTSNGTAVAPGDYTAVSNFPITYVEGETGNKTVTVTIINDPTFETNETVNLSLSHPSQINAVQGDSEAAAPVAPLGDPYSAVLTINDNDTVPAFSINDVSVQEGNSGTTSYTFTVTKTGSTELNATVNYATVDGTATAPSDFTAIGSTLLTFLPAETTKQFTVLVNGETTVETDEAFTVHLSNAVNATISDADGAGTISNDDTDVTLAVSPASVTEDGATNLVYTFTRAGVTSGALTVNFSVGGGATFNTDYTQTGAATFGATSGTVNFGAGNTTATVTVDPTADTTAEGDETAILTVTSGTGYNVASPSAATGTITNDDTDVTLAVSPASVTEDGAPNLVYTFTRTGVTSGALTVNFSVGGDATFGTDYTQTGAATFGATSGTVNFGAGNTTATVTIDPTADVTFELNETVILTVTSGTGYNVASPSAATGTISNDDSAPNFTIDDVTHNEGNAGTTSYTFTVTKTGSTALNATVDYATIAGTAITPSDFTAIGTTTLTFLPADTTKQFTVLVNGDTSVESNELFTAHLSNPSNATISDADGAGTITNDDTDVTLAVSPASVTEDGATNLVYTFTRAGVTSGALTVNFSVGGDATFGTDYTQTGAATFGATSGTVNFGAGNTTATVTVDPTADTTVEGDETAILTVTTGAGYNVASPSAATGTITNDDTDVTLTVSPASVTEDGATNLVYTFTRAGVTSGALTVNFSVGGGATFNTDYTQTGAATFGATSGTVNFGAGNTSATVTVDPTADTTAEGDETAILTVTTGAGYNVANPSAATGTITNDDTDVTLAVSPASVTEDGAPNLVYTFTRTGVTSGALTVNFSVGGDATFGTDYTQTGAATFGATSGTVNFGAGNTTATVTIDPSTDLTFESNETAILTVTSGTGYNVGSPSQATGTITNDDSGGGIIRFSAANYNTTESSGSATITVERAGDTTQVVTVNYATPDDSAATTVVPCSTISGLASPRCDFTTALGTLRFAAGETSKTFTVLISQDNYVEGTETLALTLSNLTGGAVFGAPSTATLIIADDATEPATTPNDDPENFVRQHYHDFLNREPDAAGLAFWTNQITSCGTNVQCIEERRISVSASFFLSIEFQDTGYLVERLYKVSYGDATGNSNFGSPHTLPVPIVRFSEFMPDTQKISQGVVVLQPGWEIVLENNKQSFTAEFVQRPRFATAYPTTLTPSAFVDALFAHAGVTPSTTDRDAAINEFGAAANTADLAARGRALRRVAENTTLKTNETNRAFVLMQYFGYLRRNPDAAQDTDHTGYDFWLTKLNQFNGNYIDAEMVKAFLSSIEYRQRFAP